VKKNPYSPSPRGNIADVGQLVGREEIIVDFWNFIHHASRKKFIPVIVRAPYGGGKTTLLQWVKERITDREKLPGHIARKNILAIYTKLPHPSIKAITTTFIDEVKLNLDEKNREKLQEHIKKTVNEIARRKIESESILNTVVYNNCLDLIYTLGFDVVIHIVDEFEAIAEISTEESRGFLHEFRDFIDEIGERSVVMVLGCTDEAYRLMEDIHPALVSRVPEQFRKQVDTKLRFTLENALDFVVTRIETVRSENPDITNPYYPFDRASIELLYERTGGNIRMMEQACYFALEKARKTNQRIDHQVIIDVLHQVISQKSGHERTKGVYNLVDDPKERDALTQKIRKGNPEDLKDLLFNGFQIFLMRQNFDYQFQREDDTLGERAGIARIHTHAYRTIPIDVVFVPTTIPKEFGHSDVVDADRVRKSNNAGVSIVLRLTQDKTEVNTENENIIDVSIPWSHFEEFAVLPHLSYLDAEKVCRKLEEDLKILISLNRWIRDKIEGGQIVGERFRQYETSVYMLLWRLGEGLKPTDQIFRHSRKRHKKYSKVTLLARLNSLQEKGLVKRKDEKAQWMISPVMKEIHRIIREEFKGNPVTPMDLKMFFMGGSIETLRRYMQLMQKIGMLTSVTVGRHTAYKPKDPDALFQQVLEGRNILRRAELEYTKLPNPIRVEIEERRALFQDSLKDAQQALQEGNEIKVLTSSFRARTLLEEIEKIESELKDESILVERQYRLLLNKIDQTQKHIEQCEGLGIDVSHFSPEIRNIKRELDNAYEYSYKIRGKSAQVIETLNDIQTQVDTIENDLSKTLQLYEKLINNLNKSKQLIRSIGTVCQKIGVMGQNLKEDLIQSQSLLSDAEKALEMREFARAEFLLLKILQNEAIRQALLKINTRFSEVAAETDYATEMATVATRINPETNLMSMTQEMKAWIQKAKISLEEHRLRETINQLEKAEEQLEKLRSESMATLIAWFSTALPKGASATPHELSKTFNVSYDTVLQGTRLLLKNSKLAVVRR